ncbi:MAG: HlyD family type I secretion periplasmic adaptor subunit [Proteobacteria bacterium]|nr:HlyD family type I secretion periplasmic adaptor subunit [Desulfocapsa sp.]MBU3943494.1 HlyD family type I secretion periplasmic adaptor subunit [Pseudomonadota bacterium]MCG2743506.1 HlyD family type I secretion periplasmic adaptor subunit [Desulfobacteraceae bacterium]MDO8947814.1 HlyD family type I secretion periplasmic adaptor subunit [Desulfocapsaceae bacterium]MBU3984164.1 HlyD family type I secretion periplasmic adaptor subunit [Pseudomonadota bacterium]
MKQDPEIKKSLQTPNNNGSTARSLDTQKKKGLFFQQTTDVDLITDIRVSLLAQSPRGGSILLWIILIVFFCALVWAYVAEVEEVTRANGKVVPSRQLQIVQNLEGGILSEVLVNIGDVVKKGQLLLRIDEKRFSGPYRESRFNYLALKAQVARLQSETYNTPFVLPDEVMAENPEVGNREKELFESRKKELAQTLGVLEEQSLQRRQEITELEAKIAELSRTHYLLQKEINMTQPLVKGGAVSEVEFLRLQRQNSEMQGDITASRLALPRAKSRLLEAQKGITEAKLKFSNTAKKELNDAYAKLEGLSATTVALADRLDRTAVLSPVRGIVNQIFINTVGGVIQPGMNLIEIVPLEDTLLVEAKVKPSDIAFLSPNLKATVKFTAYDFTLYGGLEAKVEHISADSIVDKQGDSYYLVNVRTTKNYLGTKNSPLPIIPGMVASVDILTGKKRVLTYLMKPIFRAQSLALRER